MNIDWQRILLLVSIALVTVMLLGEWVKFQEEQAVRPPIADAGGAFAAAPPDSPAVPQAAAVPPPERRQNDAASARAEQGLPRRDETAAQDSMEDLPNLVPHAESAEEDGASAGAAVDESQLVRIETDVLQLSVYLQGGDIFYAALPTYPVSLKKPDQPFVLLENNAHRKFVARSGLIGPNGPDGGEGRPLYRSRSAYYALPPDAQQMQVDLFFTDETGTDIIKRFGLRRGEHQVTVEYLVQNRSGQPWQASLFGQLRRDNSVDPHTEGATFRAASFLGFAIHTLEQPYEKMDFDDLREKPFDSRLPGGWVAAVQHYFLSAWVPDPEQTHHYRIRAGSRSNLHLADFVSPPLRLAPGESGRTQATLYLGPKDQQSLAALSPGLELTVDYGWLWWLSQPLFQLLFWLHGLVGNWGVAIILLTVLVKAAFYPLSAIGYRSMAKMRALQPKVRSLQDLHGQDRQKLSQEMMGLYRREKVNPMGGCLPMLIQMPVFLALYWVLLESVELRQAPFFGWIHDLSVMDPWFVLPLLMGVSMFAQQKLSPQPPDPMQARIMQWLPVVFTVFFLFFPAGLVLYWLVNNILSILQQWLIMRQVSGATTPAA